MSDPVDPTPPQPDASSSASPDSPDAQPTQAHAPADTPVSPDAQLTEAYAPVGDQPTAAYPPADVQPTEVYPPAGGVYGQPPYGQPAYGAPVDGDPALGQAPVSAADRPKTMGWIALGVALGGLALVGAAFIPMLWVSVVLAVLGGLLLLVALVLGIVTLASKKQGGKGLGISAIALSILGGIAWIAALSFAVFLTIAAVATTDGGAVEPSPSASVEAAPDDEATEEGTDEPTGAYDEAAYLAQVRPEILAIMQELDPSITEEMLGEIYSDEVLVSIGDALLVAGDVGRETIISSLVEGSGDVLSEDQATRFYEAVYSAAQQHLVE